MLIEITQRLIFVPNDGSPVIYERTGERDLAAVPTAGSRYEVPGLRHLAINSVITREGNAVLIELDNLSEAELSAQQVEDAGFVAIA